MTETPKDPFAGLADLQKRIADSLRPFAEVQERLKAITVNPPLVTAFENAAQQFVKFNEQLARAIAPVAAQFGKFAKQIAVIERQRRFLDQAGFLPHVTTPVHLIEECANDPAQLSHLIESYYRDNWVAVRDRLIARINSFKIDDEAKQSFREALTAHEYGLYRATCRHLFSEIERVARVELHNNTLGTITSQKTLQGIAGELSLSEVEPHGYFGLELFKRLTDHLYVRVRDEEQRKRMDADPVPNRHAAAHGLVVYRSFKNSLNTVFMTDYVFQIVDAVKRRQLEKTNETQ